MKDKKFQVFVSSTYTDLKEERQAAVEAILSSGNIPAGMELFSAGDESQMTVIKRWIDESDIFLLILGGRYGSIEQTSKKSYTHLEYEYAVNTGKPLFAVIIGDNALDKKIKEKGKLVLEDENPKELKAFRNLVTKNLVKFWEDSKDIKLAIHETLADFIYAKDLTGWVRGDNTVNSGLLAEEIARLTKENSELRDKLNELNVTDNALYNNLTFNELKHLLESDFSTIDSVKLTLYTILILIGEKVVNIKILDGEEMRAAIKLTKYKLVKVIQRSDTRGKFEFTEEGHNFYLKAILNRKLDTRTTAKIE